METALQYDRIASNCRRLFLRKNEDYGPAWTILRPSSLTDQLYIKARRIRSIEEKGSRVVADDPADDYMGIINYSVMALISLSGKSPSTKEELLDAYDRWFIEARNLMQAKNTDYGEVWREMRISSITDLILMKLLRIKQIEDNQGKTQVSEGLEANFLDIINYGIFALIKIEDKTD